jgi:hypothetical protein
MEIDEYRDYEKALNALKRAGEYMTKARGDASREEKVQALKSRIMHIEQVSRAAAAFPFFFLLFFFSSSSSICSSSDETNSHE